MTKNDKALAEIDRQMNDFSSDFAGVRLDEHEHREIIETIRQALTPQSSADLGMVRTALALHRSMALSGEQPSLGSELAFTEALAILDQQAAPYDPLRHNAVGENKAPSVVSEKQIADILNAPLTALRTAVAAMKKPTGINRHGQEQHDNKIHNAAITEVLRLLDEVERV